MTAISRAFLNGNSQAASITQEFRLGTSHVEIYRNTDGDFADQLVANQEAALPPQVAAPACANTTPRSSPDCAPQAHP